MSPFQKEYKGFHPRRLVQSILLTVLLPHFHGRRPVDSRPCHQRCWPWSGGQCEAGSYEEPVQPVATRTMPAVANAVAKAISCDGHLSVLNMITAKYDDKKISAEFMIASLPTPM